MTDEECGRYFSVSSIHQTYSRAGSAAIPHPTSLCSATFPPGEGLYEGVAVGWAFFISRLMGLGAV